MGNLRFSAIHPFEYRNMQQFFGQMPLLKTEMERWKKQKHTVVVFAENSERTKKLEELFLDFEIPTVVNNSNVFIQGDVQIQEGMLASGFELPDEKLVVLVEKEILHTQGKKRARKQTISNAERLKSYNELKP